MANILTRFKDIMAANVNSMLDKMEDPEKMIDQYLRNMERDLSSVKAETAAVMAVESAAKRKAEECKEEISKMETHAKKALKAGNEGDAKLFLQKKETLTIKLEALEKDCEIAVANSTKMREMHDKLADDIQKLSEKRTEIKTKLKIAKTTEKVNSMTSASGLNGNKSAFERMEEKANKMLDEANAKAELNTPKKDEVEDLMKKYDDENSDENKGSSAIDEELEKMKKELGL